MPALNLSGFHLTMIIVFIEVSYSLKFGGFSTHPTLAIDNRSPALLFPSCDIAQDIRAYVRYLRMNRFINY